jgi:hypothetical protein
MKRVSEWSGGTGVEGQVKVEGVIGVRGMGQRPEKRAAKKWEREVRVPMVVVKDVPETLRRMVSVEVARAEEGGVEGGKGRRRGEVVVEVREGGSIGMVRIGRERDSIVFWENEMVRNLDEGVEYRE